jgi:putative ABC transport system permease protein
LIGAFAAAALVLASIGVYGVIAYAVNQRRREIGIRLALGARRGEIVGGVLRHGVLLCAAGTALGLAAAAASTCALDGLLFNVGSFDAASFAIATALLFVVALAGCALPARRAAGVDPSIALRAE